VNESVDDLIRANEEWFAKQRRQDAWAHALLGPVFLVVGALWVVLLVRTIGEAGGSWDTWITLSDTGRRAGGPAWFVIAGLVALAAFFLGFGVYGTVSGVRRLVRRR
jgi:hypothetical protein